MDYQILTNFKLFNGIDLPSIEVMLKCFKIRIKDYKKNDIIFPLGTIVDEIGLILEGSVDVKFTQYDGNETIFNHIPNTEIFLESYAIAKTELISDIISHEDSKILFINVNNILNPCNKACSFHNKLTSNFLNILAKKNLVLSNRMRHITPKTIKERVILYLSQEKVKNHSNTFTIPFSREELALYLNVERTALSKELSKLKKEGILDYNKNKFTLY